LIKVNRLTKKYGNHTAVNDISFEIKKGGVYGFLGPNGAGKSTTMNIITGCLAATEGEVTVGGFDIYEEAIKAKKLIGYLPENPPLYTELSPYEYLKFVAEAKGVKKADMDAELTYVMTSTGLVDVAFKLISSLSKGYKQRVGIAQAMLGSPEIIILDEPTVGLDPKQIIEIRELIKSLGEEHTILFSSHILSEVQELCENVIIIANGKIVANDSLENLRRAGTQHPILHLVAKTDPMSAMDIIDEFEEVSHYAITECDKGTDLELTLTEPVDITERLFFAFAEKGIPLLTISAKEQSLEELYLKLTESALMDELSEDEEDKNDELGEYTPMFTEEGEA